MKLGLNLRISIIKSFKQVINIFYLLLEDNSFLLQESGDKIIIWIEEKNNWTNY